MADSERIQVPAFSSEEEEAAWWDRNQEMIADRFRQAAASGQLGEGRVARQAVAGGMPDGSPTLEIQIPETDISRARALAARKGLRYQTYLRILIHEGLEREEQRAG